MSPPDRVPNPAFQAGPPARHYGRRLLWAVLLSAAGHVLFFGLFALKPPQVGPGSTRHPAVVQIPASLAQQVLQPRPGQPQDFALPRPETPRLCPLPPLVAELSFRFPSFDDLDLGESPLPALPPPAPGALPPPAEPRWSAAVEFEWSAGLAARARPQDQDLVRRIEAALAAGPPTPLEIPVAVDGLGRVRSALVAPGFSGRQGRDLAALCRRLVLAPRLDFGPAPPEHSLEFGTLTLHR